MILHPPFSVNEYVMDKSLKDTIKCMAKYGTTYNYYLKIVNKYSINIDNVAKDIEETTKDLQNFIIIALGHASPYGLYYSKKYSKRCLRIITPNERILLYQRFLKKL